MTTQRHFGRDTNKRETESPLKRPMGRQREKMICHKDFFPLSSKIRPEFSREQWGFLCRALSRELWRRHLLFFFLSVQKPPTSSLQTLLPVSNHVIQWDSQSQSLTPLDAEMGHSLGLPIPELHFSGGYGHLTLARPLPGASQVVQWERIRLPMQE